MNTSRTFALRFLSSKATQLWLIALAACAALLLLTSVAHAADAASVDRTTFDHLTTGFELTGQHRDLLCESCHVNAIFKGTPKDCAACHGVGTAVRATAKPVTHILSTNKCEACHTPVAWNPAVNFDHAEVIGGCFTCHNGVQAQGQGPNHIETNADCGKCHTTISWAGAVFNHPQVVDGCSTCHSPGGGATSLPPTHIPTDDAMGPSCAGCHAPTQYTTFAGANMNHLVVTSIRCDACHEAGMSFTGTAIVSRPPPPHPIVGSGDCSACHLDTVSFKNGNLMPANHIPTTQPCTLCHSNPADYSIYVMNHAGIANGCAVCHAAGKSFANMAPPVLKVPPSDHIAFGSAPCEACHAATDFTRFMFTNASGAAPPAMIHSVVAGVSCGSCHGSGLSFAGAPPTVTMPANHVPIAGADCAACHSQAPFASFTFGNASGTAPPAMVHSAVTSIACSTCHEKGLSWAGVPTTVLRPLLEASGANHPTAGECSDCHQSTTTFKGASNFPNNHIPLTGGQTANCTTCHADANNFSGYTMGAPGHALVSNLCETCHASGKSFANMVPPVLKEPPANHVPFAAAACSACHSASNFTSFQFTNVSGAAPSAMVHSAVPGVSCATCHGVGKTWVGSPATVVPPGDHIPFGAAACEGCHAASDFTTFKVNNTVPPMNHAVVSSLTCSSCHGAGKTWRGTPVTVTTPIDHVPIGTADCGACHSPTTFTSFLFSNASGTAPPSMVHSAVASIVCSACHEVGKSWVGAPATKLRPALKADGTAHVAAGECSTCHFDTVSFKGASDLPANHIPLPAADNNNCALCHTTPGNYSLAVMSHANIASNCAQCHAAGRSFANMAPPTLVLPPANHVPFGTAACESCHSPTVFTSFKFNNASGTAPSAMVHAAVSSIACGTCHGRGLTWSGTPITVVEPTNHIPIGTTVCTQCHTATNFTSFAISNVSGTAPPSMVHTGFTTNCITCHGAGLTFVGTPATKVFPANHIPTATIACEGCHSNSVFTNFIFANKSGTAPSSMVHSKVTSIACSACHEAGKSWAGAPATVLRPAKKADGTVHVATGECSSCHLNTTSFKGAVDYPPDHIPNPGGAASNCNSCHTTGVFSAYVMSHAGITNGCKTCHGYNHAAFAGVWTKPLTVPPAGPTGHIPTNPPNSSTMDITCESCHSASVFTTFAGTVMRHAFVTTMQCMACHELGMAWKTNTGVRLWQRESKKHYPGIDCTTGCHEHSARDKRAIRRTAGAASGAVARASTGIGAATALSRSAAGFDHRRVAAATCVSCHGPTSGSGKPAGHITSSDRCESCHSTVAWLPVTLVDHTQVTGSCGSCHNGTVAKTKGKNHIASSNSCETCHTTNAWTPARFDHVGVVAHTCKTCHDSLHATGLPANHVPTAAQCDTCHGALAWKPAKLDHTTLIANCVSCHNNSIALGVPAAHMSTQRDCATCHSYSDWTVLHFVHVSAAYPGEHSAMLACAACHTSNADQIPWASSADKGSCAGCHAKDFKPDRHPKISGGVMYTASELHDCTGACHVYSDATLGKTVKPVPGPYHRVSDVAFKH